eukprot:c9456_g1_i1.p1 GENE.c9456_g1_i1~~c9456_g1_i1.p1  ORF type:complete len:745 (+),score=194.37 c9456_g1_i1:150-2237(+)
MTMQGSMLLEYLNELQRQQASLLVAGKGRFTGKKKKPIRTSVVVHAFMRMAQSTALFFDTKTTAHDILKVQHSDLGTNQTLETMGAKRFDPEMTTMENGYDLNLGLRLSQMCDFAYLGPYWWESQQSAPSAQPPSSFSLKAKLFSGQMQIDEKFKDMKMESPWDVIPAITTPLEINRNSLFSNRVCWKNGGMIFDANTETQILLLQNDLTEEIFVIFRGRNNPTEMLLDRRIARLPNPYGKGAIHKGFLHTYKEISGLLHSAISELTSSRKFKKLRITGHGFGGALATIAGVALYQHLQAQPQPPPHITVYTFGSPMVGNAAFVRDFESKLKDSYRHVLDTDMIPLFPPRVCGYRHVRNLVLVKEFGVWISNTSIVVIKKSNTSDFTPSTDHAMSNYARLLKRHRIVMEMVSTEQETDASKFQVNQLRETWFKVLKARPECRVMTRLAGRAFAQDKSQVMPSMVQVKLESLNLEELRNVLATYLANNAVATGAPSKPVAVLELIESEMRYIARGEPMDFSHFLSAYYDLFNDQHAPHHRLWAYIRKHLEKFDLDDDRMLEPGELLLALKSFNAEFTTSEIRQLMSTLDLDSNGTISYTECFLWLITCMRGELKFSTDNNAVLADRFVKLREDIQKVIGEDTITTEDTLANITSKAFESQLLTQKQHASKDFANRIDALERLMEVSVDEQKKKVKF